jgi:hypothetical protein
VLFTHLITFYLNLSIFIISHQSTILTIGRCTLTVLTPRKKKIVNWVMTQCLLILEVLFFTYGKCLLNVPSALDEFLNYFLLSIRQESLWLCVHTWWIVTLGHSPIYPPCLATGLSSVKSFEFSVQGHLDLASGKGGMGQRGCMDWAGRKVGQSNCWVHTLQLLGAALRGKRAARGCGSQKIMDCILIPEI